MNPKGKCFFSKNMKRDTEPMKDVVLGAIAATGVVHSPRSLCALHQNVISAQVRNTWSLE